MPKDHIKFQVLHNSYSAITSVDDIILLSYNNIGHKNHRTLF